MDVNDITKLSTRLLDSALTCPGRVRDELRELTELTANRTIHGHMAAAWIDATIEQLGLRPGVKLGPKSRTGKTPEEAPAEVKWASDALICRVNGDAAGWAALVYTLPADDVELREYLYRLLAMLATTMHLARSQAQAAARAADVQAAPASASWAGRAAKLRANSALN